MDELEFIKEVLQLFAGADFNWGEPDPLLWRIKEGKVQFVINCNDQFYWACADCEHLEPEDLPLLRATVEDLRRCEDPDIALIYTGALYACRKRGMRPQRPVFRKWTKVEGQSYGEYPDSTDELASDVRALFDAAGPERDPKDEG